jgi:hypothetical protein
MSLHDLFGHLKHKLWPNQGPWVKLTIWLPTIKSRESPCFIVCRWPTTYRWKVLNEGYNFALNPISIRVLHTKLLVPKVMGVPIVGISRFPLGSPRTKWHLGVGSMARHKVYYKVEGGGFPQVWVMMSLVSPCLLMAPLCTKVLQPCTNQLVVWFVQVHVSKCIDCQSS